MVMSCGDFTPEYHLFLMSTGHTLRVKTIWQALKGLSESVFGQWVLSVQEDPQMMILSPNIVEILILLRFNPAAL
jgi:hypothetical protein